MTQRQAGFLFNLSKTRVSQIFSSTVAQINEIFVPQHLGFAAWPRTKLLQQVPNFVNILYPDKNVVGVVDATYLYCMFCF